MNDSILFISLMNGAAWGGSEELWYQTALRLAVEKKKVACAVYDWPEKKARLQQLKSLGCEVYLLPRRDKKSKSFVKNLLQKMAYKKALGKALSNIPVEEFKQVVVNQGGYEVYTGAWKDFYQQLSNYSLLFHNYNPQDKFSTVQQKRLKNWMKHAAGNFFAAHRAKEVLEKQLSFEIPSAAVFYNPIGFPLPVSATAFPSLQNGRYILCMFAALDFERKAQDKLVRILSGPEWRKRNWELHFYGDGKDRHLLQQMICSLHLQDKIFLKGYVDDVAAAMGAGHLILQITRVDAMPISVVEAMALARPLVVSKVGDMPEWISDDHNGWVCEFNEQEMDAVLEKAWQSKEDWKSMGQHSFERFKQMYPVDVVESFLQMLPA